MAPDNRVHPRRRSGRRTTVLIAPVLAVVVGVLVGAGCSDDDGGVEPTASGATTTLVAGATTVVAGETTAPAASVAPVATTGAPAVTTPAATAAPVATTAAGPVAGEYIVQSGDTLGAISARVGVSVAEIAQFNGITNINQIQAGQVLRIPAPGTVTVTTAPPITAVAVPGATAPPAAPTLPPTSASG